MGSGLPAVYFDLPVYCTGELQYEHEVVASDGKVFDVPTGPASQSISDYAARWQYPDFILEALVK